MGGGDEQIGKVMSLAFPARPGSQCLIMLQFIEMFLIFYPLLSQIGTFNILLSMALGLWLWLW